MGSSTANVSRRIFDERNSYLQLILQAGVPLVDADFNEGQESFYFQLRRAVAVAIGDGAKGNAFKITEHPDGGPLVANSFLVQGGFAAKTGPEILWVGGHPAMAFDADMVWTSEIQINAVSTGLTETCLFDSAGLYAPNELVGKFLVPAIGTPSNSYEIISNTANQIEVEALSTMVADGASPGDHYNIELTTPSGGSRVDIAYLDVYLDEIDSDEDTNLKHTLSTTLEAMRRWKLIHVVRVAEGTTPPATGLIDSDGNEHCILSLAQIDRPDGEEDIDDSIITDLRGQVFSLAELDDRFVNETGDSMSGDLNLEAGVQLTSDTGDAVRTGVIQDKAITQAKLDPLSHLLGVGDLPGTPGQKVHDERYTPSDLLQTLFGPNMVVNGQFLQGLEGWISNEPLPVASSPGGQALENVRVGWRLCSPGRCGGLYVHFQEGYKGCDVGAVAQEIDLCGGGLLAWSQTVAVALGSGSVKPTLRLALFSSKMHLGDITVPFLEKADTSQDRGTWLVGTAYAAGDFVADGSGDYFTTVAGGTSAGDSSDLAGGSDTGITWVAAAKPEQNIVKQQIMLDSQYGARQMRALVQLPSSVETVVATLMFEPDIETCGADELMEVVVTDVRGWRFADSGSVEDGVYVPPVPPSITVPAGDPQPLPDAAINSVGGSTAETAILLGEARNVPVPIEIDENGILTFRAPRHGDTLNVYHSPNTDHQAFEWGQQLSGQTLIGFSRQPALSSSQAIKSPEIQEKPVAVPLTAAPPRIETIASSLAPPAGAVALMGVCWQQGTSPHITITGRDFDASLTVDLLGLFIQGGGVNILNLTVNGPGTSVEFDAVVDPGTVGGVGRMILTNPDGQVHEVALSIAPASTLPVLTAIQVASAAVGLGDTPQQMTFMVRAIDQFNNPVPGATIDAVSGTPADVTIQGAASVDTDHDGIASFTFQGEQVGSSTVTFTHAPTTVNNNTAVTVSAGDQTVIGTVVPTVTGSQLASPLGTEQLSVNVKDDVAVNVVGFSVTTLFSDAAIADTVPTGDTTDGSGNAGPFTVQANATGLTTVLFGAGGIMAVYSVAVDEAGIPPSPASHSEPFFHVTGIVPAQLYPSTTQLVEIFGAGLLPGAELDFTGDVTVGVPKFLSNGQRIQVELVVGSTIEDVSLDVTNPPNDATLNDEVNELDRAMTITATDVDGPGDFCFPTLDEVISGDNANCMRILVDPLAPSFSCVTRLLFGGLQSQAPGELFDFTASGGGLRELTMEVAGRLRMDAEMSVSAVDVADKIALSTTSLQLSHTGLLGPGPFLRLDGEDGFNKQAFAFSFQGIPVGFDFTQIKGIEITLTPAVNSDGFQALVFIDTLRLEDVSGVEEVEDFTLFTTQAELDPFTGTPTTLPICQLPTPMSRRSVPVVVAPSTELLLHKFFGDPDWENADVIMVKGRTDAKLRAELLTDVGVTDWSQVQNRGAWVVSTVYVANDLVLDQFGVWWITAAGGTSAGDDTDLGGGSDTGVAWTVVQARGLWASGTVYVANDFVSTTVGTFWLTLAGGTSSSVGAKFCTAHFASAPASGCRAAFIEPAVIVESNCLSVGVGTSSFDFFDSGCQCAPDTPSPMDVSGQIGDRLLHRLVPDDGFDGTPIDYGETFWLDYCDPALALGSRWVRLGSQSTPNQILHGGGGRNDPNVPGGLPTSPGGDPIYATLFHGPCSNQSARESLLSVDALVATGPGPTQVAITVSPAGVVGFAVGLPVWLYNKCRPGHPSIQIGVCEIERSPLDPGITGVYGTVISIDSENNIITVEFEDVSDAIGNNVTFDTAFSAALMVAPAGSMGFYWEASEGLAEIVNQTDGTCIRWWYRRWEAAANDCEFTDRYDAAAVGLWDGNGITKNFDFVGDTKNLMDPTDWRTLWSRPIHPVVLTANADIGAVELTLCDNDDYEEGDLIRIVDDQFPFGWITYIDEPVDHLLTTVHLADAIPATLPGVSPAFDGFKTARNATTWKPVTRANKVLIPSTRVNGDGTPLFGSAYVGADFENGRFTFERGFSGRVRILYCAERDSVQMPAISGTALLTSINKAGIEGDYSTPIQSIF